MNPSDAYSLNQSVVEKLLSFLKMGSHAESLYISISGAVWCFFDPTHAEFVGCMVMVEIAGI